MTAVALRMGTMWSTGRVSAFFLGVLPVLTILHQYPAPALAAALYIVDWFK